VEAGDQQADQVRDVARRIIHEEQGKEIEQIRQAIETSQKWHFRAALATVFSAAVAAIGLGLGAWSYYESAKREADIAANEALMRHFDYATQQDVLLGGGAPAHNSGAKYESVATHGIYTANTIVDLTEGTDERASWNNTVRGLLNEYEGFIDKKGLPCDELDGEFESIVKEHLGEDQCIGASSESQ
jgi:hypothetical protein